jgi:hypothetical protein
MKCLGKVVRTAHVEGRNWHLALDDYLLAYRATPHPSTNKSPAGLMFPGRRFKTLLPQLSAPPAENDAARLYNDNAMNRAKQYADNKRHTKEASIRINDTVLVRQRKTNKLSSFYNPQPLIVTAVKGSMVTAQRRGKSITRNSSFFKVIPAPELTPQDNPSVQGEKHAPATVLQDLLPHPTPPAEPINAPEPINVPAPIDVPAPFNILEPANVPDQTDAPENRVPPPEAARGEEQDPHRGRHFMMPPETMTLRSSAFALPPPFLKDRKGLRPSSGDND